MCACIQISVYMSNKKDFPYYFELKQIAFCKSDCNIVFSKGSGMFGKVVGFCGIFCQEILSEEFLCFL